MNWVRCDLEAPEARSRQTWTPSGPSSSRNEGQAHVWDAGRRASLGLIARNADLSRHLDRHCQSELRRALSLLVVRRVAIRGIARLDCSGMSKLDLWAAAQPITC
jgi:hypothetical protein